jgi:hypothetical protein
MGCTETTLTYGELKQLDGILQATQLLKSRAEGRARDRDDGLFYKLDPDRHRLDAYVLGLLNSIRTSAGGSDYALRLLVYLSLLCELGPGTPTVHKVEQMLAYARDREGGRYAEIGRLDMLRVLARDQAAQDGYADLLLAESVSHKL